MAARRAAFFLLATQRLPPRKDGLRNMYNATSASTVISGAAIHVGHDYGLPILMPTLFLN
jgi:hypothetical protein